MRRLVPSIVCDRKRAVAWRGAVERRPVDEDLVSS